MKNHQTVIALTAVFLTLVANAVSLRDFQRRANETDDTGRLQRAVDAACEDEVSIPAGVYLVSAPIAVTNYCSLTLARGTVIRATKEMPYVIDMDIKRHRKMRQKKRMIDLDIYNLFMSGGTIDGNGLADCMRLDGFIGFSLRNVTFLNGRRVGLMVASGWELMADHLYFKTLMSGLKGNAALFVACGDNHFTDIISVDYTIGVHATGGANRYTRCHVWGGEVPPRKKGEIPEMLLDSIGFWLDGGGGNVLRDCYADTAKTGFLIDSDVNMMLGCRYFNAPWFKMDDVLIIDHRQGCLLVSEGIFAKSMPHTRVYDGVGTVEWKNNMYPGFSQKDNCPGAMRFFPEQTAKTPNEWQLLLNGKPYELKAKPGQFAEKGSFRPFYAKVFAKEFVERFPDAGPGKALVIRARATQPATKKFEVKLTDDNGRQWTRNVPLTQELKTIRLPFEPGGFPDIRHLERMAFCFGNFLAEGVTDVAHGYEVVDVRIEQ